MTTKQAKQNSQSQAAARLLVKPKYLSRLNSARHIGSSVQYIDKLMREGKLTRYKIGERKVVVSLEQLDSLVQAQ